MADDPNRDILPVREGSCPDTCRSNIDPRERHIVYKLDRYELEDRYLRLLDEANNLKKLSNCQEDKIKRLATKLMRVTANPRTCTAALDIFDDKNKIIALELENAKLKDKISVLRNQLLSHTIAGRSSSRSRNPQARPSSGRITCRSESSRTKIPSCHCIENDDNQPQNNLSRVEELEEEKKEMSSRLTELEKELSACTVTNQREKVAENVEYIRVWRQMKQLNDKLIAAQSTNESLNVQINDLKRKLEETTKNNQDVTTALLTEKKRLSELDEQMLKAKDSHLSLREKDEQIKDLANELKILQQHNNELIALSSKSGDVELENMELKKKVNEQLHDQQNLKTAYNTEQANIVALQASNEQLLRKLQELQKNIDTLTVQLTSFQTQTDTQGTSMGTQLTQKQTDKKTPTVIERQETYEENSTQVENCKKCCAALEKLLQLEEVKRAARVTPNSRDKCVQTEYMIQVISMNKKDQGTSVMTPVKEVQKKEETRTVEQILERSAMTESPLTPEKMLRLLEQAQINTPLEAAKFAHKEVGSNVDYSDILDLNQRHRSCCSGTETLTQDSQVFQQRHQQQQNDKDTNTFPANNQLIDPTKILSMLYNILQGYSFMCTSHDENATLYRPTSSDGQSFMKDVNNNFDANNNHVMKKNLITSCKEQHPIEIHDLNNNIERITTSVARTGCSTRKSCSSMYNKLRQEKLKRKIFSGVKKRSSNVKFAETENCSCTDAMKCHVVSSCEECCNGGSSDTKEQYQIRPMTMKSATRDVTSAQGLLSNASFQSYGQSSAGTVYTRKLQSETGIGPYRSWESHEFPEKGNDDSDDENKLHEYMKQLDKCRQFLETDRPLKNTTGIPVKEIVDHAKITDPIRCCGTNKELKSETRNTESLCSLNCPNECVDASSSLSDSFPIVIADGEGLIELHILSLQLSTSAKQILFQETDICNISLFVSLDFWNQDTAYTPTLKCSKLNFNSSFVYRIPDLCSFFNYVLLEFVIFRVNVFHEDRDGYLVARGKLCIKDILDYPQNKLHYIAPVNSVLPCSLATNFGQLSLWVRLSCDVEKVEAFKQQRGLLSPLEYRQPTVQSLPRVSEVSEIPEEDETVRSFENDLLVLKHSRSKEHLSFEQSKEQISMFPQPHGYASEPNETAHEIQNSEVKNVNPPEPYTQLKHTSNGPASADVKTRENSVSESNHNPKVQLMSPVELTEEDTSEEVSRHEFKDSSKTGTIVDSENKGPEDLGDSSSVIEFNALISNSKADDLTKRDSTKSIHEVTDVISERNWQEYRRRSLLTFTGPHGPTGGHAKPSDSDASIDGPLRKDTIIIEIVNIILFPKSSVMHNDEIRLIYVEYSFLGYSGVDMETVSVKKPKLPNQKLTYNFRRKFQVDERNHSAQDNIMRAMLNDSSNPNIKFIVVSEPLPEETDSKECVEIGIANFNIREYALGDSEKIVSLPIHTPDESEQIGLLKIFVLGLNTIRRRLGRQESNF